MNHPWGFTPSLPGERVPQGEGRAVDDCHKLSLTAKRESFDSPVRVNEHLLCRGVTLTLMGGSVELSVRVNEHLLSDRSHFLTLAIKSIIYCKNQLNYHYPPQFEEITILNIYMRITI